MSGSRFSLLNERKDLYSFHIGLDYWEHDHFYLSSEIGYLKKGGKESFDEWVFPNTSAPVNNNMEIGLDYIQINTTFRLKTKVDFLYIYAGIGPKIDFLIHEKYNYKSTNDMGSYNLENNIKKISFGLKPEIGLYNEINKIQLGINFSYLVNIGRLDNIENNLNKIRNNTFLAMFSVGYQIK